VTPRRHPASLCRNHFFWGRPAGPPKPKVRRDRGPHPTDPEPLKGIGQFPKGELVGEIVEALGQGIQHLDQAVQLTVKLTGRAVAGQEFVEIRFVKERC
jgi:hypothetical protein